MHQPRAAVGRDVVGQPDVVRPGDVDEVEGPGVRRVLQGRAGEALEHLHLLTGAAVPEHVQQRLGHDQHLVAGPGRHVGDRRVDGHRGVGHQRPGGRRPDQQRGAERLQRPGRDGEADVHRRVDDVLVALRHLVVGQGRAAARAVRGDPVVLDQQALVGDLLERPPDRLHVGGVHGAVGAGHVDPVAHPRRHALELVDVAGDALAAAGVELRDAVRLDVALAGEPQLLLHRQLDGQAVAVPPGATGHRAALHGLEAREQVLEDAGLDVVGARPAVGGRRALVEHPRLAVGGLLQAALEDAPGLPALENPALERGQVDLGGQLLHAVLRRVVRRRRDDAAPAGGARRGTTLLGGSRLPLLPCVSLRWHEADVHGSAHRRAHTVPGSLWAASCATGPRHCDGPEDTGW